MRPVPFRGWQSYVESFYGDNDGNGPFECWATECFAPGEEIFQS